MSHWLLHFAAVLYGINLLVGAVVQWSGWRIGPLHHWLYALVFATALTAGLSTLEPALLLSLTALAVLPFMRGGTARHALIAGVGALGYAGAYLG